MSISALFPGMEAYLDGDVEINNNVTTPEEDEAMANQSAEIANDVADANSEAKDSEIQAQMLVQMGKLYTHVKTYGIDRTFLSIYNTDGELDKVCGIRFPSCESFPEIGNPHSQYSARFIAAMEDENTGFWHKVRSIISSIWEWIRRTALKIWYKITALFGKKIETLEQYTERFKKLYKNAKELDCYGILGKLHASERHELSDTLERLSEDLHDLGSKAHALASWCKNSIIDSTEASYSDPDDAIKRRNDDEVKRKSEAFANCSTKLTDYVKKLREVLDTIHADSSASTGKCSASDIISIVEYCAKTLPDIVENRLDVEVARAKDYVGKVFSKASLLKELDPEQAETGKLILGYVTGYQNILKELQTIMIELTKLTTDVLESLKNIIDKN